MRTSSHGIEKSADRPIVQDAGASGSARQNGKAMKIAVLSRNRETIKDLRDCFADDDSFVQLQIWPGEATHLTAMVEQERPAVLLLERQGTSETELDGLEEAIRHHPGLAVVLLCVQPSPEFLLRALRIGIGEAIRLPLSREALQASIERSRQRRFSSVAVAPQGKTMAFLPCKGGAGATFIATNLAYAIAAEGKRVCLIDLNFHFGEASLFVSEASPPATVADVVGQMQRLDDALLEASMLKVAPNFWLLAAPDSPEKAVDIRAEHIGRIVEVARGNYDFVVLDVSRTLDANAIKALDCADAIYPVLQMTLPFIRDAGRLLKLFRSLSYPEARVHLLVNRYDKGGDIDVSDVERSLEVAIAKTLPNSFRTVTLSINQGRPILELAPRDPVSKGLREMARELAQTHLADDGWLPWRLKRRA